jgi:hypothetical protein
VARPAVAAFLGLIEVEGEDAESRYEAWHASDHLPENKALPGVVYANRWHASEKLRGEHAIHDSALGHPQFLISYFFGEPLETSLEEWNVLAQFLGRAGRMFDGRSVRLGGLFAFEHRETAPAIPLSPRAVPHRPHAGVYLHLANQTSFSSTDHERFSSILERPGVTGGIRFASADVREYGQTRGGRAELYFCDSDPAITFADAESAADCVFAGIFLSPV